MALGKQIHWETDVKAMNQQSGFAVHHAECGLSAIEDDCLKGEAGSVKIPVWKCFWGEKYD